jgi:hypothetical protein
VLQICVFEVLNVVLRVFGVVCGVWLGICVSHTTFVLFKGGYVELGPVLSSKDFKVLSGWLVAGWETLWRVLLLRRQQALLFSWDH